MRIMTVALGTALVLCNLGTFSAAAHAQAQVVREPRGRPIIRVPVVRTTPYWDYYFVPRYRDRPEDDRVDPCGGPRSAGNKGLGRKRKRFRCGRQTLWVLAVCMVEIGRVGVKAGNAPIEQKSAVGYEYRSRFRSRTRFRPGGLRCRAQAPA